MRTVSNTVIRKKRGRPPTGEAMQTTIALRMDVEMLAGFDAWLEADNKSRAKMNLHPQTRSDAIRALIHRTVEQHQQRASKRIKR